LFWTCSCSGNVSVLDMFLFWTFPMLFTSVIQHSCRRLFADSLLH
jgi:hypothetical protein